MIYLRQFNDSFCEGIEYYNSIHPKLAARFVAAVDLALGQIMKYPKIGRQFRNYRAYLLKDFPYSICYSESSEGELRGLVLFHHKQKEPFIGGRRGRAE